MDFFDSVPMKKESMKIPGVITGTVLENYNKDYLGKIKVSYSFGEKGKNTSGWIPVSMPYVAEQSGTYFLPEVGTEVLISFIMGNMNRPIVIGSLWSESVKMPTDLGHEKNTVKMIKTKAGHQIVFGEEKDKESIQITSKSGISFQMLDKEEKLVITDKNKKNTLSFDFKNGTIALDAEKSISLKVGGTDVIKAEKSSASIESSAVKVEAKQKLEVKGQTTSVQGSTLELKSSASLKANASGILEIKGSLVKLN